MVIVVEAVEVAAVSVAEVAAAVVAVAVVVVAAVVVLAPRVVLCTSNRKYIHAHLRTMTRQSRGVHA